MNLNSIPNAIARRGKKLNDESKLCFGAAIGCFLVGTGGWLVNLAMPESTLLQGLLVVAAFYAALGVVKLFQKSATDAQPTGDLIGAGSNASTGPQKAATRQLKSAA